jgi:hypothetical protein
MRCPSCSKFVSFAEPEVDVDDYTQEAEDGASLTADVTVTLPCAECGEELKSASLTAEGDLPEHVCDVRDVLKAMIERGDAEPSVEDVDQEIERRVYVIEDCLAEPWERTQDTDAKGKKITNPRYAKTYYGAEVTWNGSCGACNAPVTRTAAVEEQASAFEEVA